VGNEVLVAFINGDPDWPIMVGNVNNAASPALYDLPANKTQSGIKTRSTPGGGPDNFNELRFEDQKGSEEVYLQAEKNWNVLVKSRKGQTVGGESGTVIGKNCDKKVGGDSYTIVTGKQTEIANEIIIGADTKITIVSGNSFIEISPAGIKINGPKVDINDGSSAPSLEKRPVTGSTGKTSGGGGGKSGESPPSPKQSAKKASKPEPAIPASKPEAAKPDDGWKAGPVKDVEVEAAEGDGRGWTEVPAGGWPDTSKLPSGGWDEKLPVGMPAADKWTLGSVSDKASGLGDFASSGSSSVLGKSGVSGAGDLVSSASSKSAGLQANIAEARSTIGNAGSIKDAAISGVKNRANEALNSTANKMLDKTGIPGTQTNAAQELTNLGSLLKKPEIA